jgi:hypothetical protein
MLAGLYARASGGRGQSVATSLLGAGILTVQVLTELGFTGEQIEALLAAKIARQLED